LSGVSVAEVRTEGAPVTVRVAGLLFTTPEEATIRELVGLCVLLTPVPAPSVTGLPSEDHVIGATNEWLYWSNALAVNVNEAPGATVSKEGEIEIWSRREGGVVNPPEPSRTPEPPPHPEIRVTSAIKYTSSRKSVGI
jgi:hypothetical protein